MRPEPSRGGLKQQVTLAFGSLMLGVGGGLSSVVVVVVVVVVSVFVPDRERALSFPQLQLHHFPEVVQPSCCSSDWKELEWLSMATRLVTSGCYHQSLM